jgi:hypothetical protein
MTSSVFTLRRVALAWVAVLAWAATTTAQSALDVDDVLDAHARAHGLSREAADPHATHLVATVSAFGLTGQLESWSEAPLRIWSRLELGPLVVESGFDGRHGWIRDRNGLVRRAEGPERAGLLLDAVLQTGAYLLKRPPLPLHVELRDPPQTPGTLELSLQPLQGESQTLVLDATTFVARSSHWDTGQVVERTVYEDHRRVDGMLLPHRLRIESGPAMVLDVEVTTTEHTAPRGAQAYAAPITSSPLDFTFDGGIDSGPLRMLGFGDHILLAGRINGQYEGTFLLDTGAGGNVVHRARLDGMGLVSEGEVEATGVAGTQAAGFVDIDLVELGHLRLLHQNWMALDFAHLEPVLGGDMIGVLGYDTLSRVTVSIDYINRNVRFTRPETFTPPANAIAVPLRLDSNVPTTRVSIDGVEAWVHVDTGSNNTLDLAGPFVTKHGLLDDQATLSASGLIGLGGLGQSLKGSIRSLHMAGFAFEDVPAYFHTAEDGIFANRAVAGILGAGILRQFDCTFDYARSTLWLVPNRNYVAPATDSPSGLSLRLVDAGALVIDVKPRSAAERAGIVAGDVVVGFNNRSLAREDFDRLLLALAGDTGRRVKVHLERDGHDIFRSVWLSRSTLR